MDSQILPPSPTPATQSSNNQSSEEASSPQGQESSANMGITDLQRHLPAPLKNMVIEASPPPILRPQSPSNQTSQPGLPDPGGSVKPQGIDQFIPKARLITPGLYLGVGQDDREAMLSSNYPWSAIGYLQIKKFVNGQTRDYQCTGTLISRYVVITAAHCVGESAWKDPFGQCPVDTISSLEFWPNYNAQTPKINGRPRNAARVVSWRTGKPCQTGEHNDWALLTLDRAVGDTAGWMEVENLSNAQLNNLNVVLVGYAVLPAGATKNPQKGSLTADVYNGYTAGIDDTCQLRNLLNRPATIAHTCDTNGGGSGGPIFYYKNSRAYILATHAFGFWGQGAKPNWIPTISDSRRNEAIPARNWWSDYQQTIAANNSKSHVVHQAKSGIGGPWGDWSEAKFCPQGTGAIGYGQHVQPPQGKAADDVSMTEFELLCNNQNQSGKSTWVVGGHPYGTQWKSNGTFCSGQGECRHWAKYAKKLCPAGQWVTGFALKVESGQGNGDDTAADSAKIRCSGGQELEADNAVHWADSRWGPWQTSPIQNSYICGVRNKVEKPGGRDPTGLNDIEVYWCQ